MLIECVAFRLWIQSCTKSPTAWATTAATRAGDGATAVATREEKIQDQRHTRDSVTVVDSRRTDIVIKVSWLHAPYRRRLLECLSFCFSVLVLIREDILRMTWGSVFYLRMHSLHRSQFSSNLIYFWLNEIYSLIYISHDVRS